MAGPVFSGAFQLTVRLLCPSVSAASTVGAVGFPGGSVSLSVTVTMMVWEAVKTRSPAPDIAVTLTTYSLSVPLSAGSS